MLAELVEWMSSLPPGWIYLIILGIAYLENVLPPIPGDMVVVFGGYLAGIGRLDIWMVVLLATLGGAAGFMTMYMFGHMFGTAVMNPKRFRWLPKKRIKKVKMKLRDWGFGLVAANRFLSGLRSVISLTVGMAHMKPLKTAAYATLSAFVWTLLIGLLGMVVGENWEIVRGYLQAYGWIIMALVGFLVAVQVIRWRLQRTDDEGEPGDAGS